MNKIVVLGIASLALAGAPAAHAQKKPVPVRTAAMAFAKAGEAWSGIVSDRKSLGAAIAAGKLADAHDLVFSIRDAAVTLPYDSTDLSAAKQKQLTARVQAVARIATALDRVADANDLPKTKAEFANLVRALAAIEAVYPPHALPATPGTRPMSAAEKALFLTPGGKYTAADIAANGNTSSFQKFAGYVPSHNADVPKGAPVCPISETRPDPKLTWIVGGKKYTFCCPPCIAEFVQKAKTAPASIRPPEAYVKK